MTADAIVRTDDPAKFVGTPFPRVGARVVLRNPGPPWLVVYHDVARVIAPRWPFQLWRVDEIESAPASAQMLRWATRATAFTVVEEVPPWLLFGPHGEPIASILNRLTSLDGDDVMTLSRGVDSISSPRWNHQVELRQGLPGSYSLVDRPDPAGPALRLAALAIDAAARRCSPGALATDPDDGCEILIDPDWRRAAQVITGAIAAYASPDSFSAEEAQYLRELWRARFGDP